MKYALKLILLAFLISLWLLFYSVIPSETTPPIPPLSSVPIPKERPQPVETGAHMCATYRSVPTRIPGTNLVFQKMIAAGMKPCHLLEPGSFDWYMAGRNV